MIDSSADGAVSSQAEEMLCGALTELRPGHTPFISLTVWKSDVFTLQMMMKDNDNASLT